MRDRHGMPLPRGVPLSGDRLRSNPEPGDKAPARPFSARHWRGRAFLFAGGLAAILITSMAFRVVVGLGMPEKPTLVAALDIPSFAALIDCNAHFSHEILRIKNDKPAHNTQADLPRLHRNYRRLHRLVRQVGRRDGISPEIQTENLRQRVNQLNRNPGTSGAAARDRRCRAMANMPIARKRHSQLIVGR